MKRKTFDSKEECGPPDKKTETETEKEKEEEEEEEVEEPQLIQDLVGQCYLSYLKADWLVGDYLLTGALPDLLLKNELLDQHGLSLFRELKTGIHSDRYPLAIFDERVGQDSEDRAFDLILVGAIRRAWGRDRGLGQFDHVLPLLGSKLDLASLLTHPGLDQLFRRAFFQTYRGSTRVHACTDSGEALQRMEDAGLATDLFPELFTHVASCDDCCKLKEKTVRGARLMASLYANPVFDADSKAEAEAEANREEPEPEPEPDIAKDLMAQSHFSKEQADKLIGDHLATCTRLLLSDGTEEVKAFDALRCAIEMDHEAKLRALQLMMVEAIRRAWSQDAGLTFFDFVLDLAQMDLTSLLAHPGLERLFRRALLHTYPAETHAPTRKIHGCADRSQLMARMRDFNLDKNRIPALFVHVASCAECCAFKELNETRWRWMALLYSYR